MFVAPPEHVIRDVVVTHLVGNSEDIFAYVGCDAHLVVTKFDVVLRLDVVTSHADIEV